MTLLLESHEDDCEQQTPLCSLYALAEGNPFACPLGDRDPVNMECTAREFAPHSAEESTPPLVPARCGYPQRKISRAATTPIPLHGEGEPKGTATKNSTSVSPAVGTLRRRPPPLLLRKMPSKELAGEEHVCGGYVLGQLLGQGCCSRVYATRDGTVAVKRMNEGGDEFKHVFSNEFQILRSLKHPSIIRVFEMGMQDGHGWLSMEFFGGEKLTTAVESDRVSWRHICTVLRPIASAVAYLHSRDICHRDVKPDNILVNLTGDAPDVRLIDFNVAALRREGFLSPVGALPFVAPEVCAEQLYDFPVDVWGFGATGYFLVAQKFPQARARFRESVWSDGLPGALRALITACLQDELEARPHADAVVAWLDDAEVSCPDQ
jgi:serine/threonine protein kinase